jgi:hypothetical protein
MSTRIVQLSQQPSGGGSMREAGSIAGSANGAPLDQPEGADGQPRLRFVPAELPRPAPVNLVRRRKAERMVRSIIQDGIERTREQLGLAGSLPVREPDRCIPPLSSIAAARREGLGFAALWLRLVRDDEPEQSRTPSIC